MAATKAAMTEQGEEVKAWNSFSLSPEKTIQANA